MKPFMGADFLLQTETAKELYHGFAAKLPIIDYHCHVSPKEIYENKQFSDLFDVWLSGDHYKWRIMRSNGVDEYYITGDAPRREKFQKFAEALPKAIGNPMYHWCHLELKTYFGYEGVLNGETLTLDKATITAKDATKEYDGTALTQPEFEVDGLAEGDSHEFTVVMTDDSTITVPARLTKLQARSQVPLKTFVKEGTW